MENWHNISGQKGGASSSRPQSSSLPAPGTVVMASIDEDLGDGRYALRVGQTRIAVNSRTPLKLGQSLILRSEASPEGKITLVVQGQAIPDKHAAGKIIYGPGRHFPQNFQNAAQGGAAQTNAQTGQTAQTGLESVQDDLPPQNGYSPAAKNGQEAGNQMAAGVSRVTSSPPPSARQSASELVGLALEPLPELEESVPALEEAVEAEKGKIAEKTKPQAQTQAEPAPAPKPPQPAPAPQPAPTPTQQQQPTQPTPTTPPQPSQPAAPQPPQSETPRQPAPPPPAQPQQTPPAPPPPQAAPASPPPQSAPPSSPPPEPEPPQPPQPATPQPEHPPESPPAKPDVKPDVKEALTQMVKAAELPLAEEAQEPVLGTGGKTGGGRLPDTVVDKAANILLRAAGLTPDDATLEAARALVKNNVQIDRQLIQALMAVAAGVPDAEREAAVKAAARLAAKDIPIAQPLVSGLADVMSRTAGPAELMRHVMESLTVDPATEKSIPPETRTLMRGAKELLELLHVDLGQSDAASALERYVTTFGKETMAKALTLVEVSAQAILENNPALQKIDRALTQILTLLEGDIATHEQAAQQTTQQAGEQPAKQSPQSPQAAGTTPSAQTPQQAPSQTSPTAPTASSPPPPQAQPQPPPASGTPAPTPHIPDAPAHQVPPPSPPPQGQGQTPAQPQPLPLPGQPPAHAQPFPGTPVPPNAPNIPNAPVIPNMPNVPNVPNVPDAAAIPATVPGTPEVPDVPNAPANIPEPPRIPGQPPVQNLPNVPTVPTAPGVPTIPAAQPPELPRIPNVPTIPDISDLLGQIDAEPTGQTPKLPPKVSGEVPPESPEHISRRPVERPPVQPPPLVQPPIRARVNAYLNAPRALPVADMLAKLPPMPKLVSINDPVLPQQPQILPATGVPGTPLPTVIIPEEIPLDFAQHLSSAQQEIRGQYTHFRGEQPLPPTLPPSPLPAQPVPAPQTPAPSPQGTTPPPATPGNPTPPTAQAIPELVAELPPIPQSAPTPTPQTAGVPQTNAQQQPATPPLPAPAPSGTPAQQPSAPQPNTPQPLPAPASPAPQANIPQAEVVVPDALQQSQQPSHPQQPPSPAFPQGGMQRGEAPSAPQQQQPNAPQPNAPQTPPTQPEPPQPPRIPQGMEERPGSAVLMKLDSLFQTPGLNRAEFDLLRPGGFLDRYLGSAGTGADGERIKSEADQLFRRLTSQNGDNAERALRDLSGKDPEVLRETASRLARQEAETMRRDPVLEKLSDAASTLRDLGRQALAVKAENVAGQDRNPGVMLAEVPFKLNDDAGDGRMQMFYRKSKGKEGGWSSRVILDLNTTRMGPVLGDLRFFGQDMAVNIFVERQELAGYLERESEALIDGLWAKGFRVKARFMVLPSPARSIPQIHAQRPEIAGENLPENTQAGTQNPHKLDVKG